MNLPFLISLPHAGLEVPAVVKDLCRLSEADIIKDGDEGAAEIYAIESSVRAFVSTEVARAIVDQNRASDDFRPDGVIKTETCWQVPVYSRLLTDSEREALLREYYFPYHRRLSELAAEVVLGIDCHTMATIGPPIGPLAGEERPHICVSDGDGTLPAEWMNLLLECLSKSFEEEVRHNFPFKGGYIIREHSKEVPWVQIEMSRVEWVSNQEKRQRLLQGLEWFARKLSA